MWLSPCDDPTPDPDQIEGEYLLPVFAGKACQHSPSWNWRQTELRVLAFRNLQSESLSIPVPSLPESETDCRLHCGSGSADIDALIDAKQKLLDLLAEKRRAIVAEAVMRGLDP